jgi:hypothetical protein
MEGQIGRGQIDKQMDGHTYRKTNTHMDEQTDSQTDKWIEGHLAGQKDEIMLKLCLFFVSSKLGRWKNRWMNRQTDKWTDRQSNGQIY